VISAIVVFLFKEARPRLRPVLLSSEAFFATFGAVACFFWGSSLRIGDAAAGDVAVGILTYAAIAFGFCLAGLTIALTVPDQGFAKELAWSDPSKPGIAGKAPKLNSYNNLLFIFTWTAIAHWVTVVGAFSALIVLGKAGLFLPEGSSFEHRVGVSLLAGATIYAVELFLVTLVTLFDVGRSYVALLQRNRP
jgi:hypothetical protein